MNDDRQRFQKAEQLFHRVKDLPPDQRNAIIEETCGDDQQLRNEVEALLAHHDQTQSGLRLTEAIPRGLGLPAADTYVGQTVGPYSLQEILGEGGMGVVYRADQTSPIRRTVALKLVKLGMDTREVISRFDAERQTLALMDHPNVARVLDAGATDQGRPYFVMEYVRGVPVTAYCDDRRLTVAQRLRLFTQVCQGVQHAHQKGIIHRDLKPGNILVMEQDGKPVPKVIDFGVAKATDHVQLQHTVFTEQGQLIGTPEYMSPEQADLASLGVDTRTDVYALGVLLYEMLAGVLPFDSRSLRQAGLDAMRRIICEQDPTRPSAKVASLLDASASIARTRRTEPRQLQRQLRGDLDVIIMKALDKVPNRRYGSATDLAADVQRHLGHEPVVARPPSVRYRIAKHIRRNWVLVASTAAIVLALLVGLAGTTWGVFWALGERETAKLAAEEAVRNLADSHLQRGKLLGQKGQWRQALRAFDAALEAGHSDPIQVQLWRIRSFNAMLDFARRDRAIETALVESQGSQHYGELLLWQAHRQLSPDDAKLPSELVGDALDSGLPLALKLYAVSLRADTVEKMLAKLRRSLEEDTVNQEALSRLIALLILKGERAEAKTRTDTARLLFPQDARFQIADAMIAALDGNLDAAEAPLEAIRGVCGSDYTESLRSWMRRVVRSSSYRPLSGGGLPRFEDEAWIGQMRLATECMELFTLRHSQLNRDTRQQRVAPFVLIETPAPVVEAYRLCEKALLVVQARRVPLVGGLLNAAVSDPADLLDQAAQAHPDALFYALRAMVLIHDGKFAEAEAALAEASAANSFVGAVKQNVPYIAAGAAAGLYLERGRDPDIIARALQYAREAVDRTELQPGQVFLLTKIAMCGGDLLMARRLIADATKATSADDGNIPFGGLLLKIEMLDGNYERAIKLADRLLSNDPQNAAVRNTRRDAVDRLDGFRRSLSQPGGSGNETPEDGSG